MKLTNNKHEVYKLYAKFFDVDTTNWRQLRQSKRLINTIKFLIKLDVNINKEDIVFNTFELIHKYGIEVFYQ